MLLKTKVNEETEIYLLYTPSMLLSILQIHMRVFCQIVSTDKHIYETYTNMWISLTHFHFNTDNKPRSKNPDVRSARISQAIQQIPTTYRKALDPMGSYKIFVSKVDTDPIMNATDNSVFFLG